MNFDSLDRDAAAVYACIAERGIDGVTMDRVAAHTGASRATFYRQYPNWRALASFTHRRTLHVLNRAFPERSGDRRLELEHWWATLMDFFATNRGRAFLALRPHAASLYGMHEVEHHEREILSGLRDWLGASPEVMRVVWALVLAAGCLNLDDTSRAVFRELVWSVVTSPTTHDQAETELDLGAATALHALI